VVRLLLLRTCWYRCGQVRFNPSLYKVLGTWSGEPWGPQYSNLSQLFIFILAFSFYDAQTRPGDGHGGHASAAARCESARERRTHHQGAMPSWRQAVAEIGDISSFFAYSLIARPPTHAWLLPPIRSFA
jgi:hypothetical protein